MDTLEHVGVYSAGTIVVVLVVIIVRTIVERLRDFQQPVEQPIIETTVSIINQDTRVEEHIDHSEVSEHK